MKQSSNVEFNAFIAGLNTEASPLNFPANASYDEENFELTKKGTRSRRLGIEYETGNTLVPSPISPTDSFLPVNYRWNNPAGSTTKTFLVIQEFNKLSFYDLEVEPLSTSGLLGSITLSLFPSDVRYSITSVDGRLVVASGATTVAVVSYDNPGFSVEYTVLKVRDMWGVEELSSETETDMSYRPASFDSRHLYNLQNQSWGIPRKDKNNVLVDPIEYYKTNLGVYPSNSETVWAGLQYQPVSPGNDPFERLYTNLYLEVLGANTLAAKGYYVIDVMNRGVSRAEQFVNNYLKYPSLTHSSISLPNDTTPAGEGPKLVCEFAGRVFYAGFGGTVEDGDKRSPNLTNHILFSRLIRHRNDYGVCHQEGDPSSRESNEVVDTDGGFIRIAGCETILGMIVINNSLIVTASNGVWAITGGSDYGFSASNYKVDKISSYGSISRFSLIEDGSAAYFWAEEAIYQVTFNENGVLVVNNITKNTIETFYQLIPNESKRDVLSVYDSINRRIRWIYHTGERFQSTSETIELILDLNLAAFYKFRIQKSPNNLTFVAGAFSSPSFVSSLDPDVVVSDSDFVIADSADVVVSTTRQVTGLQTIRYLVYQLVDGVLKYTFALYKNANFIDWSFDNGGTDAKAFLITGDTTGGDSSKMKQIPYVVMHFKKTETGIGVDDEVQNQSSCLIRSQWNWSTQNYSNKWNELREAYRYNKVYISDGSSFDNGFSVITTKNKLRGRGRSFALYMETSPGKNCIILGWNLTINGNPLS